MGDEVKFSSEAQRYFDREPVERLDSAERAAVERVREAVEDYAGALRPPGDEVDRAVMRQITVGRPGERPGLLRWFFASRVVRVRPAVLAMAASVALIAWWLATARPPAVTVGHVPERGPDTVLVRFELLAPSAHEVSLAGSFNGWAASGIALRRSTVPGLWTVTLPLSVGEHQYLFVVDGSSWIADPSAHAQVDDGFGRRNSVIVVGPRGVIRS